MLGLGTWFAVQLAGGIRSIAHPSAGGTAYWAHIGGFLAGATIAVVFKVVK